MKNTNTCRISEWLSQHPNHPSYQDVSSEYDKQEFCFVQILIEYLAEVPTE